MATARTQRKQVKAAAAAVAEADAFIAGATDAAVERGRRRRRADDGWPCTAEQIEAERAKGLSWRQVATNLGLGNPGQARTAYTELTGRHHSTSEPVVRKAPKGTAGKAALVGPGWDDDTDQELIEATLNGPWVEEEGEGKNYTPAHWQGTQILVARAIRGTDEFYMEEVHVGRTVSFTFGPNGDQPLQVEVHQKDTGASRVFFVTAIREVR